MSNACEISHYFANNTVEFLYYEISRRLLRYVEMKSINSLINSLPSKSQYDAQHDKPST